MLRTISGFKAHYHTLTMVVVREFDEWKVLLYGPDATIHGTRQFAEAKAKDHALNLARDYVHERQHENLPVLESVDWAPTGENDWLVLSK